MGMTLIAIITPIVVVIITVAIAIAVYMWKTKIDRLARERAEDTGIYMVADFIFKKIDKDKSGTIDPDELAEFLAGPGGMSASEVGDMIKRIDADGNGEIDLQEWRTAWLGGLASEIGRLKKQEINQAESASKDSKRRASLEKYQDEANTTEALPENHAQFKADAAVLA